MKQLNNRTIGSGLTPTPKKFGVSRASTGRGFTMIETAVVIGTFILISGALLSFIFYFYRTQRFSLQASAAVEESRRGLNTAVFELRQAQESEAGNFTIESASGNQIIFYSDIDGDSRIERVSYTLSGGEFRKGVVEPSGTPASYPLGSESVTTLARNVVSTSTVFTYYNGEWPADTVNNPLGSPVNLTETKIIRIQLKIDLNPSSSPKLFEAEAYAHLRNLKDNL